MSPTPDDQRRVAIEHLESFGLSSYAARTFVALASLGTGTARDVSQVAEVPRTRVYDAVDELRDWGLVDVKQSSPKEFWATSAETASRTFQQKFQHRTERLRSALDDLEPVDRRAEQRGVWTVEGQPPITERVLEMFESAEEEIVYMTVEDLLTEGLQEALGEAADRGVSVRLGGVSPDVRERITAEIPEVGAFESMWAWSDTPAGRVTMVDGQKTLVSVLVNGEHAAPSAPRAETAIWGEGTANSLVVVLRAMFGSHREETTPTEQDSK